MAKKETFSNKNIMVIIVQLQKYYLTVYQLGQGVLLQMQFTVINKQNKI